MWVALISAVQLVSAAHLRTGRFAYDFLHHGEDWSMGQCGSRTRQSPIDVPDQGVVGSSQVLTLSYAALEQPTFDVHSNGHTYAADLSDGGFGGVVHEGTWYNLMNINVHAPSEHTFAGARMPVELHLVHKRFDSDALLIVALPFDSAGPHYPGVSGTSNPVLQAFLRTELPRPGKKVAVPPAPLDIAPLLQDSPLLHYEGSMTAPPCAETVQWFIRKEPVVASHTQVQRLLQAEYNTTGGTGNYRSVMPLNGRPISVWRAVVETPLGTPVADVPVGIGSREGFTSQWAQTALRTASQAVNIVKDLDTGVQSTARRQVQAFSNATPAMASFYAEEAKKAVADAMRNVSAQVQASSRQAAEEALRFASSSAR